MGINLDKYMHAPSPGPVVNAKYRKYIPQKYGDYIPEMDESGIKYEKYMQGKPAAMEFQQKALPSKYQKYIPLSKTENADKESASELVLASEKRGKKGETKDSSAADDSKPKEEMGINLDKYMHAPSPGPVVNAKYRKYIPQKYGDYIPEMDESGIKYEKYMQGKPAAMEFQQKVLPSKYQKYIPLSKTENADKESATVLSVSELDAQSPEMPAIPQFEKEEAGCLFWSAKITHASTGSNIMQYYAIFVR